MSILSIKFLLFLFVCLGLYYLIPMGKRWIVLLAASVLFYCLNDIYGIFFLLGTAIISYVAGIKMEKNQQDAEELLKNQELESGEKKKIRFTTKVKNKRICQISIALVLFMLIYSKIGHMNWMLRLVNYITGEDRSVINVIVPLGISYYTFSTIAYIADVYWKKEKAEKNFLQYFLFLSYFPKILQGPISRHKNLGESLKTGHEFNYKKVCFGAQRMVWGYFKKMVIADRLSIFVNEAFGNYQEYAGSILLVAAVFAALQLYCDFSGCMDIISGASEMFGIEIEKNFDHPFFSKSAAEFWRRWHITLGTWFKDYIYMPLVVSPRTMKMMQKIAKKFGKKAGKTFVTVLPLAVVWLLTGLWHGTGLAYIVWGIYWGLLIIIATVYEKQIRDLSRKMKINTECHGWQVARMVRTFFIFVIARIITVPNNLKASFRIFQSILMKFQGWHLVDGSLLELGIDGKEFIVVLIALLILWGVSLYQERGSVREYIASFNLIPRWAIYYTAVLLILIFGVYGLNSASSFVYMNY